MNCQSARDLLPELLDCRTPAAAHAEVRAHLASCPECQRDFATLTQTATALDAMTPTPPSSRLRTNFYAMLEEEKHSATSVRAAAERRHRRQVWRWILSPLAGAALLAAGFLLGHRSQPSVTPPVAAATDDTTKREILALQEKVNRQTEVLAQQNDQLTKMTAMFGYALIQQQQNPANERLTEVLAKADTPEASEKVLNDLVLALTLDPSPNIRLRALDALYRHAERDVVKAGVLAALPREQNPLVQLELIDFVASTRQRKATPLLEKIAADASTDTSVRDAARLALAQL